MSNLNFITTKLRLREVELEFVKLVRQTINTPNNGISFDANITNFAINIAFTGKEWIITEIGLSVFEPDSDLVVRAGVPS